MAFERISKILEAPDGSFVYAQGDYETNQFRVVCSGCPDLQKRPYDSATGALLAASFHAEHDPDERHVPVRKS
jgi:hypothetical protein